MTGFPQRRLGALFLASVALSACDRTPDAEKAAALSDVEREPAPAIGTAGPIASVANGDPAPALVPNAPVPVIVTPAPVAAPPAIDLERLTALENRLKQQETSLDWLQSSVRELQQQVNQLVVAQREAQHKAAAQEAAERDAAPTPSVSAGKAKGKRATPAVAPVPAPTAAPVAEAAPPLPVEPVPPVTLALPERPVSAPAPRSRLRPAPPLPFAIEAVDFWGTETRIVIREKGQRREVMPGERIKGWLLEGADGQTVTVQDGKGHRYLATARWH